MTTIPTQQVPGVDNCFEMSKQAVIDRVNSLLDRGYTAKITLGYIRKRTNLQIEDIIDDIRYVEDWDNKLVLVHRGGIKIVISKGE